MQGEMTIPLSQLRRVLDAIFLEGNPGIEEAYSAFGEESLHFDTATDLYVDIKRALTAGTYPACYVIYYPDTKGIVRKKSIELIPEKCGGKRFRFCTEGWGLIQFQLSPASATEVKCRIAVNSEKRAMAWFPTCPGYGNPHRWEWKFIERHARRIIRALKKNRLRQLRQYERTVWLNFDVRPYLYDACNLHP
jgi:hypothetical protein